MNFYLLHYLKKGIFSICYYNQQAVLIISDYLLILFEVYFWRWCFDIRKNCILLESHIDVCGENCGEEDGEYACQQNVMNMCLLVSYLK